jgi:predicted RNase H-like HicB family nuclease
MSAKSSKFLKKNKSRDAALDRPCDPAIERRARQLAHRYRLILEPDPEVGFIGRGLEMPTVFADGRTAHECVRATREALTAAVATMLEMEQRPPEPAPKGARQAQINVRLTPEEKLTLEDSARRAGFRGVSDFVRAAALNFLGERVVPQKRVARSSRKPSKPRHRKLAHLVRTKK